MDYRFGSSRGPSGSTFNCSGLVIGNFYCGFARFNQTNFCTKYFRKKRANVCSNFSIIFGHHRRAIWHLPTCICCSGSCLCIWIGSINSFPSDFSGNFFKDNEQGRGHYGYAFWFDFYLDLHHLL